MTGQVFGRLTVVSYADTSADRKARWYCICECGNSHVANGKDLRAGHTRSCGCRARGYKHGLFDNRFYQVYKGMMARCYYIRHVSYHRYGGRGIAVCRQWRGKPADFISWCERQNPKAGMTLDRFQNKNGPYSPSNCRWATRREQQQNMRSNIYVTYKGKKYAYSEFIRQHGVVKHWTAYRRARNGMDLIEAALTPCKR